MGLLTPRITTGLSLLHERGVRPWKEFNCAQKARQKGWFTLQHRRSLCRFVRRDPVPVPVKSWGRGAAAKALAPTTFAWRSYIRHHVILCVHPNMTVAAHAAATVLQQPCPGRFRREHLLQTYWHQTFATLSTLATLATPKPDDAGHKS